ncbi:MAG: hypothetical protein ACSHYF_10855 [Verrucomicrobiaceae bacterium]
MSKIATTIEFPLLSTTCPHCSKVAIFNLVSNVSPPKKVFGFALKVDSVRLVECSSCKHAQYIDDKDFPKWRHLGEEFESLSEEKISQQQFTDFISTLDLPQLDELVESAKSWSCSCGEQNPLNFPNCWSCDAPSGQEPTASDDAPIDLKDRHPWELNKAF